MVFWWNQCFSNQTCSNMSYIKYTTIYRCIVQYRNWIGFGIHFFNHEENKPITLRFISTKIWYYCWALIITTCIIVYEEVHYPIYTTFSSWLLPERFLLYQIVKKGRKVIHLNWKQSNKNEYLMKSKTTKKPFLLQSFTKETIKPSEQFA